MAKKIFPILISFLIFYSLLLLIPKNVGAATITIIPNFDGEVRDGTYTYDGNMESFVGYTTLVGVVSKSRVYMRFPLDSLSTDTPVSGVSLMLYCSQGNSSHLLNVRAYDTNGTTDPALDGASLRMTRAITGNIYASNNPALQTPGWKILPLGGTIVTDIKNAKTSVNRFALALEGEAASVYAATIGMSEWGGYQPRLVIIYQAVSGNCPACIFKACGEDFFSLSNSGDIAIEQGASGSNTITVNYIDGAGATVNLSVSGLPAGATASFAPSNNCTNDCSRTLTISTTTTTPVGTFPITVTGESDGPVVIQTTQFNLIVQAAPPPTYTLTIIKAGAGSGTVTSNPGGINCGADCSENYSAGTSVTLTATPDAVSVFAGWLGDPDCSDGVVTMNVSKSCTATFNLAAPPPACGNEKIDPGEQCDPPNINSSQCSQNTSLCDYPNRKYGTRDAFGNCNASCQCIEDSWNWGAVDGNDYCTNCPSHCGDGARNCGEECEGADLGGKTCADFGFSGGVLKCKANCTIDTSGCSGGGEEGWLDCSKCWGGRGGGVPSGGPYLYNPLACETFAECIDGIISCIVCYSPIIAFLMIIIAGFLFITAGGDPERIRTAKRIIFWTVVGLFIVLFCKGIISLIRKVIEK